MVEHATGDRHVELPLVGAQIRQEVAEEKRCMLYSKQLLDDQAFQIRNRVGLDRHNLGGAMPVEQVRLGGFQRPKFEHALVLKAAELARRPWNAGIFERWHCSRFDMRKWLRQPGRPRALEDVDSVLGIWGRGDVAIEDTHGLPSYCRLLVGSYHVSIVRSIPKTSQLPDGFRRFPDMVMVCASA